MPLRVLDMSSKFARYANIHRLVSTITVLKAAAVKGCFGFLSHENVNDILQDCNRMLWRCLTRKSECVICRLQSM